MEQEEPTQGSSEPQEPPTPVVRPEPATFDTDGVITSESRNWALFAHLSTFSGLIGVPFGNILGPLVIWLIKRKEDPFVERHAREATNFNISLALYGLILFASGIVLLVVLIGLAILLLAVLYLIVFFFVWLILTIVAAVAASKGDEYTYPLTIRLIS